VPVHSPVKTQKLTQAFLYTDSSITHKNKAAYRIRVLSVSIGLGYSTSFEITHKHDQNAQGLFGKLLYYFNLVKMDGWRIASVPTYAKFISESNIPLHFQNPQSGTRSCRPGEENFGGQQKHNAKTLIMLLVFSDTILVYIPT
jgi:hypothetical protein